MSKKEFVNVFCNAFDGNTPKISSLFRTEVVKSYVKEGKECSVTIRINKNYLRDSIIERILTSKDYWKVSKGIVVTATTRLHGNDKWDEQKGLDIAEHKALAKAYNLIVTMLDRKHDELAKKAVSLEYIGKKFLEKRNKQLTCAEKIGGRE